MLHFIRHGQTDANLKFLNAGGEWDIDLNETGREQARAFARVHRDLLETTDKVYVSPMRRTLETAELVFAGLNKPFERVENLREWHVGDYSGLTHAEVPDYFMGRLDPPGGETHDAFEARALGALKDIAARSAREKAFIVSHGGLWYMYARHKNDPLLWIDNCTKGELCRVTLGKYGVQPTPGIVKHDL
jgi:broad specificity phosphatase PhoE